MNEIRPRLTPNQERMLLDLPAPGKEWGDYTIYRHTHRTLRSLSSRGLADLWNDRGGNLMARRTAAGHHLVETTLACDTEAQATKRKSETEPLYTCAACDVTWIDWPTAAASRDAP